MQNTLSIIKPDAVKEKYSGKIIDFIEQQGLNIIAQKRLLLNKKTSRNIL
jgi:nucleoside diphosphate kinase